MRRFLISMLAAGLVCPCLVPARAAEHGSVPQWARHATSIRTITPIFSQLLAMGMPAGFLSVDEHANGPSYLREAVPQGETVDDWSQMITVTGAQGLAANPRATPAGFAEILGGGFRQACPTSFTGVGVESIQVDGNNAFVAFLGCGEAGQRNGVPYSESAVVLVIKGAQDYYTIQWAVRGAASATPPKFDRAAWLQRLNRLAPIALCKRVVGEKEPYPSCLERRPTERFQ